MIAFATGPMFAQEPGQPVPREWIFDETLSVAALNFSIRAPAGWHWRQQSMPDVQGAKNSAFLAIGPDGLRYGVIVQEKESQSFRPADKAEFLRGMGGTLAPGWQPLDVQIRQSDLPVAGSAGVRTKLRAPDGQNYYQYGYIVPGRRTYMLFAFADDETEPAAFSDFARSLRFLDPKGNATQPPIGHSLILLAALVGAVFDWRYIRSGGPRPTRTEKGYLAIAIGICLLSLVVLGLLGRSAETLGSLAGILTIWTFGAWELGRLRVRRANPVHRAPA